jgi:hypothetical protein
VTNEEHAAAGGLVYRKKPVTIQAVRWDGKNVRAVENIGLPWLRTGPNLRVLVITTLEGEMTAQPGDWIIKGVKGEFYPCKPDIFDATYEPVA